MQRSYGASRAIPAVVLALVCIATSSPAQRKKAPAPSRSTATTAQGLPDTAALAGLHYRYIGPEGNRTDAIAGVKGDPNTYYVGAASGGLWKSTDAGAHWDPIFDSQPVSSIGAIAVAPSDPNVVWVGTGE